MTACTATTCTAPAESKTYKVFVGAQPARPVCKDCKIAAYAVSLLRVDMNMAHGQDGAARTYARTYSKRLAALLGIDAPRGLDWQFIGQMRGLATAYTRR